MLYLLDANVLITAHHNYYPIDSVPEFWEWLVFQGDAGTVKMPIECYEEIKDGGTDEQKDLLYGWVTTAEVKTALILGEDVDTAHVALCTSQGYADDLTASSVGRMVLIAAVPSQVFRLLMCRRISRRVPVARGARRSVSGS